MPVEKEAEAKSVAGEERLESRSLVFLGTSVVIREAAQAGYELRDFQDFVKGDGMDYFLIFIAKAQ